MTAKLPPPKEHEVQAEKLKGKIGLLESWLRHMRMCSDPVCIDTRINYEEQLRDARLRLERCGK